MNHHHPLISGYFADIEEELPRLTEQDYRNYLEGRYTELTRAQFDALRTCESDPDFVDWDRRHQGYIFCDPDWLLEKLFVYFRVEDSYEENYQELVKLVGPHPLDYVNVTQAIYRKLEKENAQ